jgi:N-methylhydantoinase A
VSVESRDKIEIGIDIGGTFTDAACIVDGVRFFTAKTPSTPLKLIDGVGNAIDELLAKTGLSATNVSRFAHGTTVATNAVLEKKGAIAGLLTTQGFEDVLAIGRLKRSKLYDLFLDSETPTFLAPGHLRCGIRERVDSQGVIVEPLDELGLREAVLRLIHDHRVQAIGVCYLFSFRNAAHERRTREIIAELAPSVKVSLSSDIDPVFREYERTCVTAMDAYLRPVMETYIQDLVQMLQKKGISAKLEVMQSRGALTAPELAIHKPVSLLLSGPAAGVAGARFAALKAGFNDLITIDIGGTSSDVSLLSRGQIMLTTEGTIDRYPIRVPMVDVNTIGAGGGSIAWLDAAGGLRVGPHSAGADPGPACYPTGGSDATVTDASLMLGYLNPDYFVGGKIKLNAEAASAAISRLALALKMEPIKVAAGIHTIVNAHMSDQIRFMSVGRGHDFMSVGRGHDPRNFVLVLLGGAGPTHGGALIASLNIRTALVPPTPGVLAAAGLLVSQTENAEAVTQVISAGEITTDNLLGIYSDLETKSLKQLSLAFESGRTPACSRSVEMRYRKQSHELTVEVPDPIDSSSIPTLIDRFHALHKLTYGHSTSEDEVEFVTFRLTHSFPIDDGVSLHSPASKRISPNASALKGTRRAYFACHGWVETPIYDRQTLASGMTIESPAIVEQPDTTTVIYPGQTCRVDEQSNLIISIKQHDS